MLTLDDCIAFGELSREIVLAIAEHEHVPELSAVAIGEQLMQCTDGLRSIHNMAVAVIDAAMARGDVGYAKSLTAKLQAFLDEFPGAAA